MNEVNIEFVNCGDELMKMIELRLAFSPVVLLCPVVADLLDVGERCALGPILNQLAFGPARVAQPGSKVIKDLVADLDCEWSDVSAHCITVGGSKVASISRAMPTLDRCQRVDYLGALCGAN